MATVIAEDGEVIVLGRVNRVIGTIVEFDFSDMWNANPNGVVELENLRNGDEISYDVTDNFSADYSTQKAYWTVSATDLENYGSGKCQLSYTSGSYKDSKIWDTFVQRAYINEDPVIPDWEEWQSRLSNVTSSDELIELVTELYNFYSALTASAETLPAGSAPTAEVIDNVIMIGIPETEASESSTTINDEAISSTATWSSQKIQSEIETQLNDPTDNGSSALYVDEFPRSTQEVEFDENGMPIKVTHVDSLTNETIRTDTYHEYEEVVTEIRELANGNKLTIVRDLRKNTTVVTFSTGDESTETDTENNG